MNEDCLLREKGKGKGKGKIIEIGNMKGFRAFVRAFKKSFKDTFEKRILFETSIFQFGLCARHNRSVQKNSQ